jgi:hypothetical protein
MFFRTARSAHEQRSVRITNNGFCIFILVLCIFMHYYLFIFWVLLEQVSLFGGAR